MKKIAICVFLSTIPFNLFAQYIPGQSYFGTNNYIEYIAGDLPVIIVAPHGGSLTPSNLPDFSTHGKDNGTLETTLQLYDSIVSHTNGCIPHVIINHLHPTKLNAAREIDSAAGTNLDARQAWYDFHDFIDTAKYRVANIGGGWEAQFHGGLEEAYGEISDDQQKILEEEITPQILYLFLTEVLQKIES